MKESQGQFIPDLRDLSKKSSQGAKSGQCDWGIRDITPMSGRAVDYLASLLLKVSRVGLVTMSLGRLFH
jgi:hypothetical protein